MNSTETKLQIAEIMTPSGGSTTKTATETEVMDAAIVLKNKAIRPAKIDAYRAIGSYVNHVGPMEIGMGILIAANENLTKAFLSCDKLVAESKDPKVLLSVISQRNSLVAQQIELALAFTKIKGVKMDHGKSEGITPLSFPPTASVVATTGPVQVNMCSKGDNHSPTSV